MSELLSEKAAEPQAPKKIGKTLSLQILVPEGADVAEVITKASELGEVKSISLHDAFDYGYADIPY